MVFEVKGFFTCFGDGRLSPIQIKAFKSIAFDQSLRTFALAFQRLVYSVCLYSKSSMPSKNQCLLEESGLSRYYIMGEFLNNKNTRLYFFGRHESGCCAAG